MSEQATPALDNGVQGLADFITDDPIEESEHDELAADNQPLDDEDTDDESAEDEQEESEEDATDEPAPVETFKVSVKGEDGADTEVEVSKDELLKGYQRQADYTRKTQDLSQREQEVTNLLTQKFNETRDHYLQQAESARSAVVQLAGFKSQQELAEMAVNDPAGWVAEQQRQQYIGQLLGQIDQSIGAERQQAEAQQRAKLEQSHKQMFQQSWQTLQKEGIDRDRLSNLYKDVNKAYGFSDQELGNLMDARQVLVMRDAVAYRALQSKAKETAKVAKDAPRIPNKQNQPRNERKDKAIGAKFSSGKAKLSDLAAFLNS